MVVTIAPLSNALVPSPNVFLGYNTTVANSGITTLLPMNINNVLTLQGGLNINSNADNSYLTIDSTGTLVTCGSITTYDSINANTINVNSKFIVSATGLITVSNDLVVGSHFKVTEASGALNTGSITAQGNLILGNVFQIDSTTGVVTTTLPYTSYVAPSASTNTTTTLANNGAVDFTSDTSQYLATQTYVDRQLWQQTVRINTILGTDSSVIDSFNNVYRLVTALEGSTTATAIGGLVDQTNEINTSVSDLAGDAIDPILIHCSPAIWGNQCAPLPIPSSVLSASNTLDGWYFRNMTTNSFVTWYLPANSNMKISDFTNLYANVYAISANELPKIVIYTKPKNDGTDLINASVNASITYSFSATESNQYYCLYTGSREPKNNFTAMPISYSSVVTANGQQTTTNSQNFDSNIVNNGDEIAYFCIQTTGGSNLLNTVEFVLNSFSIRQNSATGTKGTTKMFFQNSSVTSNYVFNAFFRKNTDFTAISEINSRNLNAYNALFVIN
jgi:hypothetical protein